MAAGSAETDGLDTRLRRLSNVYSCRLARQERGHPLQRIRQLRLFLSIVSALALAPGVSAQPAPDELDPVPHYKEGIKLFRQKKYAEAIAAQTKALELNPSYFESRYQLALLYQITGSTEQSRKEYEQVVDLKPDYLQARINLGSIYRAEKRPKDAEEQFRKAIAIHFYSLPAHYNLANVLVDQDRLEEALKEYRVCLKLDPANAMVHNNMGVIYQKRKYYEEAEEEFTRAMNLAPANKTFQTNLETVRKLARKKAVRT